MLAIALLAAGLLAFFWLQRQRELVVVSVRAGRVHRVRGNAPGTLLSDFERAVKHIGHGTIRVLKEEAAARLTTSGIDEPTEQRLRNIVRLYPLSSLRASTEPERKVLTRMFGFAWLAWIFDSRRS